MQVDTLLFGKITIDGKIYTQDVVISNNRLVEIRNKTSSRALKSRYGHTPLTTAENIPWNCRTLVIGTGMNGRLPVTEEVRARAHEMNVALIVKKTPAAISHINDKDTNLVLHITC
ncbi:MAG: MTH938/NDUFAF3 family protein [Candidatus Marinimicrobia bacterium]|nr:MTH938/NDUFAF3 family protein [Candidatus Neomarinimicrobiota bacterium]